LQRRDRQANVAQPPVADHKDKLDGTWNNGPGTGMDKTFKKNLPQTEINRLEQRSQHSGIMF
jgi:hypothetical protein